MTTSVRFHRPATPKTRRPRLTVLPLEDRTAPAVFTAAPGSPFSAGGNNTQSVTTGDYNGDGRADLVTTNYGSNTVSVFLGNGSGGFTPAPGSPFSSGGSGPISSASGDFNGDSRLDLAIANSINDTVTVFLGDGSGRFTTAPGAPFSSGGSSTGSVAVSDFNGDGRMDLAVGGYYSQKVFVFLGNGSGGFASDPTSPAMSGRPGSLVVSDFNGDGRPDMVASGGPSNSVTVFLRTAAGGFSTSNYSTGGSNTTFVAVGDFNGDGRADLTATNYGSNTVSVFLGNGSGGFTTAPGSPFASGGTNPINVAVSDYNADGRPDLAVVNYGSNTMSMLLGNGSAGFTTAPASPFATGGTGSLSVAVGDFTNDGTSDLAVASQASGTVSVFMNGIRTVTTLAGPGSSPVEGQAATFTATVTPLTSNPNGTVTFLDGTTVLQTVAVGSVGVASYTTTALRVGPHDVRAVFADASGNFNSSTSGVWTVQIMADTTTTLSGPAGASTVDQVVSFTATVAPNAPSTLTPTGIVSFYDGATLLGTSTLSGGLATFSTANLNVGSHSVTAVFNANTLFNASPASNAVILKVNGLPTLTGVPAYAQADELSLLTFTAADSNAGPSPGFSLIGAPTGASIDPLTGVFTWTPTEAQGPASYVFSVRLTDGATVSDRPVTVVVIEVNTAPALINVPATAIVAPGSTIAITATASDADTINSHGNTLTYSLVGAPAGAVIDPDTGELSWTPSDINRLGNSTFKVRVADDGTPSLSDTKTIAISVKPAIVVNGDLIIGGTSGNDTVAVTPSKDLSQLLVTINKATVGTFPTANVTGKILVHGLSGNDTISVSAKIAKPMWLFGEDGSDKLTGGGGNNLLVGGDGNDMLTVSVGRNVLIGSNGADKLTGGTGDDLLIGGETIFDIDPAGLANIFTKWTDASAYSQRVADLTSGIGGILLTSTTVKDDGMKDTLSGKKGADWFLVSSTDKVAVLDVKLPEIKTVI